MSEPEHHPAPLRIVTCGSVDDGKSTLLGRLLHDANQVFADHMATVANESKRWGTQGNDPDFALLIDGLQAEREQKITVDVGFKHFATSNRRYLVADAPGHEQFTCNMASGASTASVAVLLVDARNGIVDQTRRHSCILDLLAVPHLVVAVNKMDLVDWSKDCFESIIESYQDFTSNLSFESVNFVPISALHGDNILEPSSKSPWYEGPTVVNCLDAVSAESVESERPFRMAVQWVNRPTPNFRGYSGTVASGEVRIGDEIIGCISGTNATVVSLINGGRETTRATTGQAVTLQLDRDIELGRGDVLGTAAEPPELSDQFAAKLIWLGDEPMFPHRQYSLKIATQNTSARILKLDYVVNVITLAHEPATTLTRNQIASVKLELARPVVFESYRVDRSLGGFILIDRITNETVGAGMIEFSLRRAANISWESFQVDKEQRGKRLDQKPCLLWFTGLSGSGKSTIAGMVEEMLIQRGKHCYILDGDNVRHGLSRDLGFTDADRIANIKRVAEVAKLFVDAGLITIVCLISPFRNERQMARELVEESEFIEVFVDAPLGVCEARDPKGLYQKARRGELPNFTGVDSPYEAPEDPELVLRTDKPTARELATQVIDYLEKNDLLRA